VSGTRRILEDWNREIEDEPASSLKRNQLAAQSDICTSDNFARRVHWAGLVFSLDFSLAP
jgi:hypothetical protein